jgi:hypothetical protein
MDPMPSPPFPHPESDALRLIVENAMADFEAGEVDVRGVVVHAAVHAWSCARSGSGTRWTGSCRQKTRIDRYASPALV